MAYDTLTLNDNKTLKPMFEKTCGNLVVRNLDNVFKMLLSQGADPSIKLGGESVEIHFDDDLHAGAGAPDSNNSVSYLFSDRSERGQTARVTPDFVVGYTTKPLQKMIIADEGGEEGNYIQEHRYAIKHATRQLAHQRSAMLMWEGNGKVNEVSVNGSEITTGNSGTVRVAVKDHLQPQWLLAVRRSNSFLTNVQLRVGGIPPGSGEGAVTVTVTGSAAYTPAVGDELFIFNAANSFAMPGLLSACNTTAYPLAGLNNVPVDHDLFKAQVDTPDITGTQLSHRDLIMFNQNGQGRLNDDEYADFYRLNKVRTYFGELQTTPGIYLMDHPMLNALRDSFFQTGNSGGINRFERSRGELPKRIDQGWGLVHDVDGIPCHATNMMVPGVVLRVYAPGFKSKFIPPKVATPQLLYGMGHVPGSLNYEFILVDYGTCFVKNRMVQGRLNGRTGFGAVAAGWGYEEE
jgi:hypothetical protein